MSLISSKTFLGFAVFATLFLAMPALVLAQDANSTNQTSGSGDYIIKGPVEDVQNTNPLITVVGTTVLLAGVTAVIVGTMYYRVRKRAKWK